MNRESHLGVFGRTVFGETPDRGYEFELREYAQLKDRFLDEGQQARLDSPADPNLDERLADFAGVLYLAYKNQVYTGLTADKRDDQTFIDPLVIRGDEDLRSIVREAAWIALCRTEDSKNGRLQRPERRIAEPMITALAHSASLEELYELDEIVLFSRDIPTMRSYAEAMKRMVTVIDRKRDSQGFFNAFEDAETATRHRKKFDSFRSAVAFISSGPDGGSTSLTKEIDAFWIEHDWND